MVPHIELVLTKYVLDDNKSLGGWRDGQLDKQVGGTSAPPPHCSKPQPASPALPSLASLICLLAISLSILRSHCSQPLAGLACQEFGGKKIDRTSEPQHHLTLFKMRKRKQGESPEVCSALECPPTPPPSSSRGPPALPGSPTAVGKKP